MTALILTPGQTTLEQLVRIYRDELPVTLHRTAKPGIERAAAEIKAAAAGDAPVYGVNTGFGKLASMRIAPADTATLQRNLILSHCCGVGEAIPRRHARLLMVLKLLSFGRGASGIRWEFIELLESMLAKGVTPQIPAQGSVGASGDLAPLAHMTAVIIGEGEAEYQGQILPGAFYTLRETQMPPIALLRKHNVPMAVATDMNPGSSPMSSLLLAMNMACTLFRMTPAEALAGATINAARALNLPTHGTLAPGQTADLAIWNAQHPAELAYRIGFNPLHQRIIGGAL